jgi:twitching motility protein PilT
LAQQFTAHLPFFFEQKQKDKDIKMDKGIPQNLPSISTSGGTGGNGLDGFPPIPPGPEDDGGEPKRLRLRDLDFTDLYFAEGGEAFVRGMGGRGEPTSMLPVEVGDDLHNLHRKVCEKGAKEKEFFMDYDEVRYRVSKIESIEGIWFALRRARFPIPRISELGINPRVIQYLGTLGRRSGLILLAGATGQGKTTTACSLLQEFLLCYGDVAIAIEDPPELPLHGRHGRFGRCFQIKVENGDFGRALKSTMRYNPKYILLGEIRSAYEASEALRAAINGHVVISTIHADNITNAINSLIKLVSGQENVELARQILGDGLAAVMHQTLVKNKDSRQLRVQFLFPGNGNTTGIRSKIREGKIEQLSTDIEMQTNRVMRNEPPLPE